MTAVATAELGEAPWTARDLYPPAALAVVVQRGDRAASYALVAALAADGLTKAKIAKATGYSRKNGYHGTCEQCGAATDGSNGRANAPKLCAECTRNRKHDERYWKRDTIIAALRDLADLVGRPVTAPDLQRSPSVLAKLSSTRVHEIEVIDEAIAAGQLRLPPYALIVREFGSIRAARQAAGMPAVVPTGKPAHRRGGLPRLAAVKPVRVSYQPLRFSEPQVCPKCGELHMTLDEVTGWCRACVREKAAA